MEANECVQEISEPKANIVESNNKSNNLSKRQQKKLEKHKRWLELKPLRKAKEKEKRKQKIQRAIESGRSLGPSRKMLKSLKMIDSTCKVRICFDFSLADVMTPDEFSKTFKQLHRCYSINRRAAAPLQLYITGFTDKTKEVMNKMPGCFNWDVNFSQLSYTEVFEKENIIYLTSDSPNIIENLDYSKAYIIGALVDHNRLKNICYERALKDGVGHGCLPLDQYFKFKTRKVLTIDQVYLIFLRLTEGKTWVDSVLDTVPKRKGIELKMKSDENNDALSLDSGNDIAISTETILDKDKGCESFEELSISAENGNINESSNEYNENISKLAELL